MEKLEIYQALIGNDVTMEDTIHVDCYVHNKMGLFIPSTGPCLYAAKPMHTHPSYMFVIVFLEDKDLVSKDRIDLDVSKVKDHYLAMAVSPDIPHNDDFNGSYYCIMLDKDYFEEQFIMYNSQIPVYNGKKFAICHDILKTLNTFAFEYSKQMPNSSITMEAQMTIITHWLIRSLLGETLDMRAISSNYSVARAEHYMEKHFSEKITVNRLAELGNVSVSSFNRIFKKEIKRTPMDYLMEIRLGKAKTMLRRKNISITEIAHRCGFSSSSHFSTSFAKIFGTPPTKYRKSFFDD